MEAAGAAAIEAANMPTMGSMDFIVLLSSFVRWNGTRVASQDSHSQEFIRNFSGRPD
jgi:hypothetical protein